MKKILKGFGIALMLLAVSIYGYLAYTTAKNNAAPAAEAMAAMQSDAAVTVTMDDWLVMQPARVTPTTGIVFYAGAYCDVRGYAPMLKEVAAAGYLIVAPTMPFDFSIFAPDIADEVRAAYPEIDQWIISGHSMGGAMAGRYAFLNQDNLAGLVVFDSYPPATHSLADSDLPMLLFERARADGSQDQKFIDNANLYPEGTPKVLIPGGQHMYYGSFDGGSYEEAWEPGIKRSVQQRIVIEAVIEGLDRLTSRLNGEEPAIEGQDEPDNMIDDLPEETNVIISDQEAA
ncbi:MAG: hypothetical protein HOH24_05115 [Chromatiales bacterium]|nr:hypothetical protein [Chromatiales bacterium]